MTKKKTPAKKKAVAGKKSPSKKKALTKKILAAKKPPPKKIGGPRPGSGRPRELEGRITKSLVLDAPSVKVIEAHMTKHSVGWSQATRELLWLARKKIGKTA